MVILLAQASGRRVARVRERWLAFFCCLAIQLLEACLRHIDLATHLDRRIQVHDVLLACTCQLQWHIAHGAHVHGHIFACRAIATRGRHDKRPVVVRERDRRTIDLEFTHHGNEAPKMALHAIHPGFELVSVERIIERIHANCMLNGRELGCHCPAHTLGRRRWIEELGIFLLERIEIAQQRVEGRVGDLGGVLHVVEIAVMFDLVAQLLDALVSIVLLRFVRHSARLPFLFIRSVASFPLVKLA